MDEKSGSWTDWRGAAMIILHSSSRASPCPSFTHTHSILPPRDGTKKRWEVGEGRSWYLSLVHHPSTSHHYTPLLLPLQKTLSHTISSLGQWNPFSQIPSLQRVRLVIRDFSFLFLPIINPQPMKRARRQHLGDNNPISSFPNSSFLFARLLWNRLYG